MIFQSYYKVNSEEYDPPIQIGRKTRPIVIFNKKEKFCFGIYPRYVRPYSGVEKSIEILCIANIEANPPNEIVSIYNPPDKPFDIERFMGKSLKTKSTRPKSAPPNVETNYPESYWKFVSFIKNKLDDLSSNFYNMIEWRLGLKGGKHYLASHLYALRWSDSEKLENVSENFEGNWRQIPYGTTTVGLDFSDNSFCITPDQTNDIKDLFIESHTEPLGHNLFREAWQLMKINQRSSIVIGIAAAETAFKECVVDLLPETAWLIKNIQSPPLVKMIRNYIESLPTRSSFNGKTLRPPNSMINILNKAVNIRNDLVHGRKNKFDDLELEQILFCIRDFLYLLDYYRGNTWALEHIQSGTLEEMGIH